ncbi:MAG: MFS transporter [Achromobacter sp.]|jgi:CP family cyanate transporter-like MFS transporter|uniref:2-nitroimidazole transporter n=1 Tax=Achromobacter insuavis TaxID=1287735 RepID=A0A6J5AC41_9BURK|nr:MULTISPECIES: MFS transporter [Achromobacter]MBN9639414.1 MFS transporter [Achromobacter sp.]MCG2600976.1 MFS transporter [Achromobacter sp.]CAB3652674.1 2-nitroimidazole transporter [Achromobacter insuavis]CUI45822.1 Inner membrane transport protein YeaN [Achromobacter sp. 2789STDY5608633]CUI46353.1 Inner membrane transport protein YeaN [Achromobacter sp. 2789STDY5608628]
MNPSQPSPASQRPVLLIVGILFIAMALRAPVTGVPPLVGLIREQLGLSNTAAGMLITLPLLAFAVVSLVSAGMARRHGLERTLFFALLLIGGGIVLRSQGQAWALYAGTAVIGSGIAIGNVLLPSLLKRDFPQRLAGLTSAYVLTMSIAAGAASALAVPLASLAGGDWRISTLCMLVIPLAGALLWLPQLANHTPPASSTAHAPHGGRLWHSPLAWQVTLYLGINSFVFYVGVSWLPAILRDAGYSAERAGSLHGLLQLMSAGPALFLAPVVRRMKDQRAAAFCSAAASLVAFSGLIVAPGWATLWIVLLGLGTGGGIILGLMFVGLRASHAQQAAALSGMAQCIGYLFAASGPTLVGALHDRLGGWSVALGLCAGLCVAMAGCGLLAGRNIQVGQFRAHAAEPQRKAG